MNNIESLYRLTEVVETTGVKLPQEQVTSNPTGTVGTISSPHQNLTHAHVYNKVGNEFTRAR